QDCRAGRSARNELAASFAVRIRRDDDLLSEDREPDSGPRDRRAGAVRQERRDLHRAAVLGLERALVPELDRKRRAGGTRGDEVGAVAGGSETGPIIGGSAACDYDNKTQR